MQDGVGPQMVANEKPVGVFDSGVVGLSYFRRFVTRCRREFPVRRRLGLRALGESARPSLSSIVLTRSPDSSSARAQRQSLSAVTRHRSRRRPRACALRDSDRAIEPAVKPRHCGHDRALWVCWRRRDLVEREHGKVLASYGSDVEFVIQPCPGLADQVEKGELASGETRALWSDTFARSSTKAPTSSCWMHALSFLRGHHSDAAGPTVGRHRPGDPQLPANCGAAWKRRLLNPHTDNGTERF